MRRRALKNPIPTSLPTSPRKSHPHLEPLGRQLASSVCSTCGRRAHPSRTRLTVAKLSARAAIVPVEVLLYVLVLHLGMSFVDRVILLSAVTTVVAIWVVEPSTMRALQSWLHAPAERLHRALSADVSVWRLRVVMDDSPRALNLLTHRLATLADANILARHKHPGDGQTFDEFLLVASSPVEERHILAAARAADATNPTVDRTSRVALTDSTTHSLDLAREVATNPSELPRAIAALLAATIVTDQKTPTTPAGADAQETLRVPTPWGAPLVFNRPGQPFTTAETARASRLADVARAAAACSPVAESTGDGPSDAPIAGPDIDTP